MKVFQTQAEVNVPHGHDLDQLTSNVAWMAQSVWPTAADQAWLAGHELADDAIPGELVGYERDRQTMEGHIYVFTVKVRVK